MHTINKNIHSAGLPILIDLTVYLSYTNNTIINIHIYVSIILKSTSIKRMLLSASILLNQYMIK